MCLYARFKLVECSPVAINNIAMARILKAREKLGRRIQKRRKELGYTQEELAEKLNLSRTHMGHIEQGRKSPSLEVLDKIARALRVRVKDLIPN